MCLVEKGADPNVQDMYLYTPLHYSSQYGYTDLIELLLQAPNIDPSKLNNVGMKASDITLNFETWSVFEKYAIRFNLELDQ